MSLMNALAGVAVKNLDAVQPWSEALIGSVGQRPMPTVAEWRFANGGCLQVFQDERRAGQSLTTLVVDDIEEQIRLIRGLGISVGNVTGGAEVRVAMLQDPDGNQFVLAQPLSAKVAS